MSVISVCSNKLIVYTPNEKGILFVYIISKLVIYIIDVI